METKDEIIRANQIEHNNVIEWMMQAAQKKQHFWTASIFVYFCQF